MFVACIISLAISVKGLMIPVVVDTVVEGEIKNEFKFHYIVDFSDALKIRKNLAGSPSDYKQIGVHKSQCSNSYKTGER